MRYTVGLGDSPSLISGTLSGNPGRYRELLAANPHKPIVMVGGHPTFAALGVGERLNVPLGFVGDALADAFGVGTHDEAFARLAHSFGTSDPGDAVARLAHAFGVHGLGENIGGNPSGMPFTRLASGHSLVSGQALKSPSGRTELVMQADGQLVIYDMNGQGLAIWGSGTNGKGGVRATMQPDGNLVVYNAQNQPLWASGTDKHPDAYVAVQDDGNVVLYVATQPIWATGTDGFKKNLGSHGDFFSDVSHTVNQAASAVNDTVTKAVHEVSKATGLPADQALNLAKNAANAAQQAIASGAKLVAKAGGDVGKFVAARADAIAKDPLGSLAQIAATGPLALVGNPDDILKALGIPTPSEMLAKIGIPPFTIPSPEDVAKGITDPQQLLSRIPGLSQLSKFLPAMPNPADFTKEIVAAAATGDPDKIKTAIIDVGHHVSDSMAMVPGAGTVLAGPLASAIAAIESGSPLRTALELLLGSAPIPDEIKAPILRPAVHALSDIVEKQTKVEDALISAFKEGIMTEVQKRNLPAPAPQLVGDLVDALIQVVLRNKPLDQAAAGFAKKGLDTALNEATKKFGPMLPSGLPGGLPGMPAIPGLPTGLPGLPAGLPKLPAGLPAKLPAGLPAGIPGLSAAPAGADVFAKISSLQKAYTDIKDAGDRSNEIQALTQGIVKLNKQDPSKKDPAVQKQIADMKTSIEARSLHIQASKQKIDSNIGKRPPSHVAPAAAVTPDQATPVLTVTPAAAPATPAPAAAPSAYGPYPK